MVPDSAVLGVLRLLLCRGRGSIRRLGLDRRHVDGLGRIVCRLAFGQLVFEVLPALDDLGDFREQVGVRIGVLRVVLDALVDRRAELLHEAVVLEAHIGELRSDLAALGKNGSGVCKAGRGAFALVKRLGRSVHALVEHLGSDVHALVEHLGRDVDAFLEYLGSLIEWIFHD